MTGTKRITGRRLQATRERILRRDPICCRCTELGFCLPSTQVDHIVPLWKDGEEDDSNRQGLCDEHHAEKTIIDMGYRMKGCDADGLPTSSQHHWNASP